MARTLISDHLPDSTAKKSRVADLRKAMKAAGVHAFLIPRTDEWQNEYIPAFAERLAWLTGFTGSAGFAIVMDTDAAIFVDGRYVIQVAQQVDAAVMPPVQLVEESPVAWLEKRLNANMVIGCDPWLHTPGELARYEKSAATKGASLTLLDSNLIDQLWHNQPAVPAGPVTGHDVAFAGINSEEKRRLVGDKLADKNQDALALTRPDSIAWAFNIRGNDVACTPLPLSRAILYKDGSADLFMDDVRLYDDARDAMGANVTMRADDDFLPAIKQMGNQGLWLDENEVPVAVFEAAKSGNVPVFKADNPCMLLKACKNDTEVEGSRQAHLRDGAAIVNFLHWFDREAPTGKLDELSAAAKLHDFRKQTGILKDLSFPSISAAGEHAAIPHYSVDEDSNRPIRLNEIFLIDSGGQYEDGTTDITRTMIVGDATDEMKDRFTRVLKGHIALAMARFPHKTCGHHLDTLARMPLWQAGLDFDHGTGHGVGVYLGVHEGPQRIAKAGSSEPLKPGMICSNEPGYYKEGDYGIRIENLVVVQSMPEDTDERDMMGFETITFAPIDRNLIEPALLTPEELEWLNGYHDLVMEKIGPLVEGDVTAWLQDACAPMAHA